MEKEVEVSYIKVFLIMFLVDSYRQQDANNLGPLHLVAERKGQLHAH